MASATRWVRQAAAVPIRGGAVCLVTSSSGRRWVVPKGLIDPGHTAGEAALQEAWEEAGLVGMLRPEPVGSYLYEKYGNVCHVILFVLEVQDAVDDWPERHIRQRDWVPAAEAADRVDEIGLRDLLRRVFPPAERTLALCGTA